MRITNNMILHNTTGNINGNKVNVNNLNNQMTSQKKIQRPSENPVIAVRSLRPVSYTHLYQIAKQAVAETSDIREDKVAALSAKVKSGTYDVSNEAFAEKLLEKYRSFML